MKHVTTNSSDDILEAEVDEDDDVMDLETRKYSSTDTYHR